MTQGSGQGWEAALYMKSSLVTSLVLTCIMWFQDKCFYKFQVYLSCFNQTTQKSANGNKDKKLNMKTNIWLEVEHESQHMIGCWTWKPTYDWTLNMKTNIWLDVEHETQHMIESWTWKPTYDWTLNMKPNIWLDVEHETQHMIGSSDETVKVNNKLFKT